VTAAVLQRLSAAYESGDPVLIPLADLLELVGPDELAALRADGLVEYALEREGAPAPVRAVEAHEFVDACFAHALALDLLAPLVSASAPSAL
jgi:hypothetical protein